MWRNALFSVRRGVVALHGYHHQSSAYTSEIFVSRLSSYTTEEELRSMFSPFGKIQEVRLIRDKITRRPKGFGFVRYETEEEAERAMKAMDSRIFSGRLIFVEIAKSEQGGSSEVH
ncbi:organelle RRM domain-containing protein 6, chloroplastic-like [Wolffia australiana]